MDDATQNLMAELRTEAERRWPRSASRRAPIRWHDTAREAFVTGAHAALEAAQRPPVSRAGEAELIDAIESAWTDDDPEFSAVIAKAILAKFSIPTLDPDKEDSNEQGK